jgi:long-chain acyl-CoA synthetase
MEAKIPFLGNCAHWPKQWRFLLSVPEKEVCVVAHESLSTEVVPEFPWFAHYDANVPHHIAIPAVTLPQLLAEAASQYGDRTALIFYGNRISYVELELAADRFARALRSMGVGHGDRVAICLPNLPQFPIAFYGVLKAGAVAIPTNPLYTAHEMEHHLQDSGAKVIVTLDILYPTVHEVRKDTPLEHVILTKVADYLPAPLAQLYPLQEAREQRGKPKVSADEIKHDPSIIWFKTLLAPEQAKRGGYALIELPPPGDPDDLAVLQYTGGTTGVSKGAMLSHRNLVANAIQCSTWTALPRFTPHVGVLAIPFFHVYGLTLGLNLGVYNASTMVLLPRFVPKDVLAAIYRYKPDYFPGIPTMYLAIAREIDKEKKGKIDSIKICLSGAAPLLGEVQARFEKVSGTKIAEGYGLSEASPSTHSNPLGGEIRIGTIGLPLPNTEARIIDPQTGATVPVGERGELAIRGPQVMQGYWRRPDETAKVIQDGWLRTGDIGVMDGDGYFAIVDRAKDLIIASGYNIYPREVEEVLIRHPAVQECVVVGVPDEYRGETVRAYVVLKEGMKATPEELIAFCKQDLAVYKVPKQIVFRDELPKSLVGKVLRRVLRDEAIAEMATKKSA